ncbi:MAG TPA: ATP-binding protein [Tepidisphaeraceae bacterium]|nr:ATP-binding protein [Tepidisphaeraceae bacterium]
MKGDSNPCAPIFVHGTRSNATPGHGPASGNRSSNAGGEWPVQQPGTLGRLSKERCKTMFETMVQGVVYRNRHGRIVAANPAALKILGLGNFSEIRGRRTIAPAGTTVHEDGSPFPDEQQPSMVALRDGCVVRDVVMGVPGSHSGGYCWLVVSAVPLYREGTPHPVQVYSVFEDITGRKQDEALRAGQAHVLELLATGRPLEEVLTALVETIERQCARVVGSVVLLDEDGRHIRHGAAPHLPPAYRRALDGLEIGPKVASCGTAMHSRRPVTVHDIQSDPLWENFRHLATECELKACWSRPIFSSTGRVLGSFALYPSQCRRPKESEEQLIESAAHLAGVAIERFRSEAALLRAKESAEAANRAKDDFLATVSHELRTPLGAVLLWAKLLDSKALHGVQKQAALATIIHCAEEQSQLVNDLLDATRILQGKMRADVRPTNIARVVESTIDVLRPHAQIKGVTLSTEVADAVVNCDASLVRQVVSNLLSNAIKFTPPDGSVRVTLAGEDGVARLQVTDTGEGIPPEYMPHIFKKFSQADNSLTRKHGGLGLGLSIVRHIVELHGGTVHAKSDGVGRGATFVVQFPLAFETGQRGRTPHLAGTAAAGKN